MKTKSKASKKDDALGFVTDPLPHHLGVISLEEPNDQNLWRLSSKDARTQSIVNAGHVVESSASKRKVVSPAFSPLRLDEKRLKRGDDGCASSNDCVVTHNSSGSRSGVQFWSTQGWTTGSFSHDQRPVVDQVVSHEPGRGGQLGIVDVSTSVVAPNEGITLAGNSADRRLKRKAGSLQRQPSNNTINKARRTITDHPSLPFETQLGETVPVQRNTYFRGSSNMPLILDFESGHARPAGHSFSSPRGHQRCASPLLPSRMTTAATASVQSDSGSPTAEAPNSVPENDVGNQRSRPQFHETQRRGGSSGPPAEYKAFGRCNRVCRNCRAIFWDEEKLSTSTGSTGPLYHRCCLQGRVKLFVPREYPPLIQQLFSDSHFLENIRAYNQMFAMTSLGATIDESVNTGTGPYVFKISGQIYHRIGRLCPDRDKPPRFLQLYIYDTVNEVQHRLGHFTSNGHPVLRREIVEQLIRFLDHNNALVQLFRMARDKLLQNDVPEFKVRLFNVGSRSQYELPTADAIGAIVFDDTAETESDFDIILETHSGEPQRINKLHACYMSAQFPLLFVYGEQGYHTDLKFLNVDGVYTRRGKRLSMKAFYLYQLHDRLGYYNLLSRGGKLFQQYVVTAYCSIEQSRMDYIRTHQSDIRGDYLAGLYDAITRGDTDGSDIGSRIILPSSFTGGPRYMYSHYLDALAICRKHGNPSFFITFTCNTKWPEIEDYMEAYPRLAAADRPDVVDRVFECKIHSLIKYIRDRQPFGVLTAVLYTVEFQKRGLPHCHILIWINQRPETRRDSDIDRYISAELPDQVIDPEAFRVVSEFMVHGPCGEAFPNAPCMINRSTCKKFFPKEYCHATFVDNAGYVHYRRRDIAINATRHNVKLDNAYVVPYNRELCMAFYAHINVEYCGWTMLIKYLFKYISKGTDRIMARITRAVGEQPHPPSVASSSNGQPYVQVDEIQNFVDARYIGPHEACWRIFGFDIHNRDPAVQILAVHLENMQTVTFRRRHRLQAIVDNPGSTKTTLTEWLAFNKSFEMGRHLTYLEFPSEFVWSKRDKSWSPRCNLNRPAIGRLTYVHPSAGDLFYQRILLCHQRGCTSFPSIRTVDGYTHSTNRSACEAMGLLQDDQEWITAMQEAAATATASQLRALFSEILVFTDICSPLKLWEMFWKHMSDDIPLILSQSLGIRLLCVNEPELRGGVVYELQVLLALHSKYLKDFGLPSPPEGLLNMFRNRAVMEERNYNREELAAESRSLIPQLNVEQKDVFDTIMRAVTQQKQELLFVYGHGGTGKTFLWKTVIATLRSQGKIVLAVASSGIASLLLPSGRTAHSRFKIPLQLADESVCSVKKGTQLGELLKQTDLVIWDEAPMSERRCFEALDRTFRDILDEPRLVFGGKPVALGGDFRQTLPVKKKATRDQIIAVSIAESYLWRHFKIFFLEENMRLRRPSMTMAEQQEIALFSEWLLNIGDANIGSQDVDDPQNTSWVRIPDKHCFPPTADGILQLIEFIYDNSSLQQPTASSFQEKAIVCPKNETADLINAQILDKVSGPSQFYLSVDEAVPVGNDGGASELLYPIEYLNSMKFPGIPPHRLEMKIGSPVMLLRNLNLTGGLCNGTRMIISQLLSKVIEAKIISGVRIGQKVFLPRIILSVKEENMPFTFKRKQFPIKLCYAMTINKSQGQSLKKIGVYLPEPIFGHGQLYVALSRATSPDGLKMVVAHQEGQPPNTTKNIVYKDFLRKLRRALLKNVTEPVIAGLFKIPEKETDELA
ncbi:DNA helicase [Artemisia annua]|uniref:ATP-dependent DNA helicase n=1 Tax=Artemisia annua TaxID=35608 RepID=A0A2U1QLK3_ARTAN|nr:DNA helicase [Artemisia annua]